MALKFLPESLGRDDAALARLTCEVRTARQVSHPNVCRVFDIGEAEGVPFITMEFVDGEDLASLLQRIGRLQPAKALQLSHQLCAGLAEIHAFGILHRDLKPANIMLDGRGNLRITDFGLAVVANEIPGEEAMAGTPAYMAPEQLAGEKATQQSDIYALGLILFELFTGMPAFENRRTRTSSTLKPSAVAKDIDGVIERAILRCLEKEPGARPRTASVVASALPGGDPLAAAVAAGETPSPDMVAAAFDEPAIGRAKAWMLLAVIVVALAAITELRRYATLDGLAPLDKSPDALIENAQQIAGRLGYTAPAADTAFFAASDKSQVRYLADHEDSRVWRRTLRDAFPAVHQFWWRQSPTPMRTMAGWIDAETPAQTVPGMLTIRIDQRGRLLRFAAVPPEFEPAPPKMREPEWALLFDAAGLPMASFVPAPPKWQPPMAFDTQKAWEGAYAGHALQVSAASFHGRIVYFRVAGPWDQPIGTTRPTLRERIAEYTQTALTFGLWMGGLWLARRNWLLGRGDRRGALKFGFAIACLIFAFYGTMHHGSGFFEIDLFIVGIGAAFILGLLAAALYLAIEPLVRRRWLNYLVGWTRLLAGRFSNARVGRDLLVGVAAAVLLRVLGLTTRSLPNWIITPRQMPAGVNLTLSSLFEFANLLGVVFTQAMLFWSLAALAMLLIARSYFAVTASVTQLSGWRYLSPCKVVSGGPTSQ